MSRFPQPYLELLFQVKPIPNKSFLKKATNFHLNTLFKKKAVNSIKYLNLVNKEGTICYQNLITKAEC